VFTKEHRSRRRLPSEASRGSKVLEGKTFERGGHTAMGRLEKIVVLTVLFLVALILGVSLNSDKGVAGAGGPLASLEKRPLAPATASDREGKPAAAPAAKGAATVGTSPQAPPKSEPIALATPAPDKSAAAPIGPKGLLNTSVDAGNTAVPASAPASVTGAPAAIPYLLTSEGLEHSPAEDLELYTWKAGDTFVALAERFYGSRLHVGRIKAANEGRNEAALQPGEKVFVPSLPAENASRVARNVAPSGAAGWSGGSVYVVKAGDVLGTISMTVYKTSKQWKRIYDANRDVLGDPNALKVGMKLRIPE